MNVAEAIEARRQPSTSRTGASCASPILPSDHGIAFMLAIGKGVKEAWPKPGQLPLADVLVENRFPA